MSALLLIIYLIFVSLGLPDSALGSAWPSMYGELGAGISWAGGLSAIICLGTIVSSMLSSGVVRRLGTGKTCAVSTALTVCGLFGFSLCHEFWQLCLCAIPYGLGAGSIDAALNSYAALNFPASHMSWLHCMWGVGASIGPAIMGWQLQTGSWHSGFAAIGLAQAAIFVVIVMSLPLWRRTSDTAPGESETTARPTRRRDLLRLPGVREILVCFFCYCAFETTCGAWAASYCVLVRGLDAQTAAAWASLFYLGITAGRGLSGFLTWRLSDKALIRAGQALMAVGMALVAAPLPNGFAMVGLVVTGVGCAPVYPSIIHCTPAYFGREFALSLSGMQMAIAYVGSLVMSPLFGVLAQVVSPALYPVYLGILLVTMVWMAESVNRKVAARKERDARA